MDIAICDDERAICEQIERIVKGQGPEHTVRRFSSGEELLREEKSFDILFLDIQMEGMNGIEVARRLRDGQEETILIFITGSKEYVFDAFDVSAFHYLLKPIQEEKCICILSRAVAEFEKKREREKERGTEVFFVKSQGRNILLDKKEILYMESRDRMVEVHTTKEVLRVYADMRDLEKRAGREFYRCHRGYIVNMGYIAGYGKDSITLTNGGTVYLSRRKYKEFVKTYMDYLKNGGRLLGTI